MMFLSIIKGFVGGFFSKVFGDWKILLILFIAVIMSLVSFKIYRLERDYSRVKEELSIERENVNTLRKNNLVLEGTNKENQMVIEQLRSDKQIAIDSLVRLSGEISKTNANFADVRKKLDQIRDTPVKLTPYIAQAIDGVQKVKEQK